MESFIRDSSVAESFRVVSLNVRQNGEREARKGSVIVLMVYIEKRAWGFVDISDTSMESELLMLRNWHTVGRSAVNLAAAPNARTGIVIGEK